MQYIALVHYIDSIMLIGPSDQRMTIILDLLVRHFCVRGWEINLTIIQRTSTQWHVEISLLKWKISYFIWPHLYPVGLWMLKATCSLFGCVLWPIYKVTWKATSFNGAQNNSRLCNWSRLLCELLCHLGHIIEHIQQYLKWQTGMLFGAFSRSLYANWSTGSYDFRAKLCHFLQITTSLLRNSSWPASVTY